mgnify:CR=1 FL=1
MKLAVNKKKGSFLNLYSHEVNGIFLPILISAIGLVLSKLMYSFFHFYLLYKRNYEYEIDFYNSFNALFIYEFLLNGLIVSIFVILALIAIMAFYIWLKEWFGRKKTIFTLMTLPVSRLKIILSKLLAVCTFEFILFGMCFGTIFLESFILKNIMGISTTSIDGFFKYMLSMGYSINTEMLVLSVLFIITMISFIFLLIMLNRSSVIKGSAIAIILAFTMFGILFLLLVLSNFIFSYDYLTLINIFCIVVIGLSIEVSNYLFKNLVHV